MPPTPTPAQDPQPTTGAPEVRMTTHRREIFMGVFVVVAMLASAYIASPEWRSMLGFGEMFPHEHPADVVPEVPADVQEAPEVLGGKIYMSLAPIESETQPLNVYSYNVESGLLEQETQEQFREYLMSKISPDGEHMAVASYASDGTERLSETGLFVRTSTDEEDIEVRTQENFISKRSPSWSLDGQKLAFAARKENGDVLIPEDWSVFTYTQGDKEGTYATLVTHGANPVFLPDGSLTVLKSDGVYHVDAKDGSESNIIPFDFDARTNIKFDVARDGSRIAVSLPDSNELIVATVNSWSPFDAGEVVTIPASTFWPVFSPGGEFLAMQVFDWSDESPERVPINQRLMIFSFRENTWVDSVDLTRYVQEALFITDWQ